mmetsp:Transcript_127885/g.361984  ORF Transcript_127885/g.361984 Transcript_127885/m.361984 type:complete len:257 (+) Transcript_127885:213-983(+)
MRQGHPWLKPALCGDADVVEERPSGDFVRSAPGNPGEVGREQVQRFHGEVLAQATVGGDPQGSLAPELLVERIVPSWDFLFQVCSIPKEAVDHLPHGLLVLALLGDEVQRCHPLVVLEVHRGVPLEELDHHVGMQVPRRIVEGGGMVSFAVLGTSVDVGPGFDQTTHGTSLALRRSQVDCLGLAVGAALAPVRERPAHKTGCGCVAPLLKEPPDQDFDGAGLLMLAHVHGDVHRIDALDIIALIVGKGSRQCTQLE